MAGLSWGMRRKFYEAASTQLENGLGLGKVLGDYRDRLVRRGRKKAGGEVNQVFRRVQDGKTLVSAMGKTLTDLERNVIDAGEKAGNLPQAMRLVLEVRAMTSEMTTALRSSFVAPTVYLVAMYVVLFVIGDFIVPQFTAAVPIDRWTGWAYAMYQMGQLAVSWKMPILFGSIAAYVGWCYWAMPRWTGRARTWVDNHIFPFSTYRDVQGFAWLLSFGALLRSGISDTTALRGQIQTSSPWMSSRLRPILRGIENGFDLALAMRQSGHDFPSPDLIDELGAYAGFPNFPEMIEKVARDYAKNLKKQLLQRGMIIALFFSGIMFSSMVVLQLGANSISTILTQNIGH